MGEYISNFFENFAANIGNNLASLFDALKIIGLLYVLSAGIMYFLAQRGAQPIVLPGDIYKKRGGRVVYVPTGGALVLTIILYVVFVRLLPGLLGG